MSSCAGKDFNTFFIYEMFQISEVYDNILQANVHWGQDWLFFHCGIVFASGLTLSVRQANQSDKLVMLLFVQLSPWMLILDWEFIETT